jgi:hypothetical protein
MKKLKLTLPIVLLVLSILFILLTVLFPFPQPVYIGMIVSFVLVYVSFSLLHHYLDKTLTVERSLEYILIASLVLIIVVSVY